LNGLLHHCVQCNDNDLTAINLNRFAFFIILKLNGFKRANFSAAAIMRWHAEAYAQVNLIAALCIGWRWQYLSACAYVFNLGVCSGRL
jgi:hypothetical protein